MLDRVGSTFPFHGVYHSDLIRYYIPLSDVDSGVGELVGSHDLAGGVL